MRNRRIYCAVRSESDTGRPWVDFSTAASVEWLAADRADKADRAIPHWGAANPVIRVQRFTLTPED